MKACNLEGRAGQGWLPRTNQRNRSTALRGLGLALSVAVAVLAISTTANAQALIGSAGAGWQTWTVTPITSTQPDLNDSGNPWWDLQWNSAGNYGTSTNPTGGADKNPGFCITATGDCVGMASQAYAPGTLPFWGTYYDPVGDTGGERDNKVYFRNGGGALTATLFLNATTNPNEVNDFGWFSTNATGTIVGTRHKLFSGTGVTKDQIPTPTGTTVVFTPTRYFGYYYSDVSEPACPDGTDTYLNGLSTPCVDPNAVLHGCYAYSIFTLNDQKCVDSTGGQGDHDFVVFKGVPVTSSRPTFWVVGEDPADCANADGDCNQTMVRVTHN